MKKIIMTLVCGIILAVAGLSIRDEGMKALAGVILGVGAGFIGMGAVNLYIARYDKKHPDETKRKIIENNDERNTVIRNKAKAKAGDITQWLIIALAYLSILADSPIWVTLVIVVVFLMYSFLFIFYMSKYQKEM